VRNWSYLISHALSIAFALLSAFTAFWLPWKAELEGERLVEVLSANMLNLATPLPWMPVIIFSWIYSVYRSEQFTRRLGDYDSLQDGYDLLDREYYDETEAHRETKESYYRSLRSSLKYILSQSFTGFSETCRVSVYRLDDGKKEVFRNIFRHAHQYQYDSPGRDEIPTDQGIVGLSYATSSLQEFKSEHPFGSPEYLASLSDALEVNGIELPPSNTKMPSKHILAKTISDIETGEQVGVIVYESLEPNVLSREKIEALLTQEDQNIARFVKHLAVLDSEFNPR